MFKINKLVWLLPLLIVMSAAYAGEDDSMRCGRGIVNLGMSFDQVKAACGNKWRPSSIERYTRQSADPRYRYSDGTIPVDNYLMEKWVYAFYGRFVTHVYFENGHIVRIFRTSNRS